jgi:acyl-CoA synthetase (AMP-forming)/AMP-acid ligase II
MAIQTTMGDMPLSVHMILRRAEATGPHAKLVGYSMKPVGMESGGQPPAGRASRTWPELAGRVRRLANALAGLGVGPGDRVATFAWNTLAHLELLYAVPVSAAVLQPLNVRLFPAQIAWIANHAEDQVVFVQASLTSRLAEFKAQLTTVRHYVVIDDGTPRHPDFADALDYEELLASGADVVPSEVDERSAACLCYTSGTTGNPKGVVYSHRSLTLHAMSGCFVDSFAVRESDVILPLTPLFHATAWGLPYAAGLAGASLVLAGQDTSPEAVLRLIRGEGVTMAAGVPTFWLAVDQAGPEDLGELERILCGGSAIPLDLLERYQRRGVGMQQGWGMTEMSPSGNLTFVRRVLRDRPAAEKLALHATQGVTTAGVELRVVDPSGAPVAADGHTAGEVEVRGPWVTQSYYRPDGDANVANFRDGWLRTGDIATIDEYGYLRLVDRTKDLIKSGGEWISSIEVENHLMDHPEVAQAMVIAVAHPTWTERPAALVVRRPGSTVSDAELAAHLSSRIAGWWVPDVFEFVDALPTTATGKFDKRDARATWGEALAARVRANAPTR